MVLFTSYIAAFRSYADFSGRSTRSEYWLFQIVNGVVVWGLSLLAWQNGFPTLITVLLGLYFLGSIVPRWALAMRRLHDTGRSGAWLWLYLFWIIGWIVLLIMYAGRSDYDNRFGPAPASTEDRPG